MQIKKGLSNFQNWFSVRLSISLQKLNQITKQLTYSNVLPAV